jgi:pimeloyl-ACP methyl ester carboxylesterase
VRDAEVVGHSLGGAVVTALAQDSPQLVDRVVIVDTAPDHSRSSLGFLAGLAFAPVIGEAAWRIKPDFAVHDGLEVAFAPGFDFPDAFVDDVNGMTFSAYDDSPTGSEDFVNEKPLDERMRETGKPLLVIMGAEEQIIDDPAEALAEYEATVPGVETQLIAGSGHSPAVEKPARAANLILGFAKLPLSDVGSFQRDEAERGARPQRSSSATSPDSASGVRMATGDQ